MIGYLLTLPVNLTISGKACLTLMPSLLPDLKKTIVLFCYFRLNIVVLVPCKYKLIIKTRLVTIHRDSSVLAAGCPNVTS